MTVKEIFEQYKWCKHAFARDSNGMGIPAINGVKPSAFSLAGAIHFAYRDDAIAIIHKCQDYILKKHKYPFTLEEWQDKQLTFDNIALLIEELEI